MITLLALITFAIAIVQIASFSRLYRYVKQQLSLHPPTNQPYAAVILPCKGLDPGFEKNISRLLDQDYHKEGKPHFKVIFAVASEDDPAFSVLNRLIEGSPVPCQVVVAGVNPERAQKINNQLHALRFVEDADVLVFVDSDVIARDDFLRYLIAPLADPSIGATTGYRFYLPDRGGWPSLIRALWNRMTAWELANPKYAFAWGGAMAIRRETFDRAGVRRAWDKAADDDLSLTTAVKRLGLSVHFVPQCLVASHGDADLPEVLEWTNRQLILTKVYYPKLWWRAIVRATIMAIWLVAMVIAATGALIFRDTALTNALLIGLSLLPVELYFLIRAQNLWRAVLCDRHSELKSSFWPSLLAIPIAHLALPWMTLYSLVTNRIRWRGVTYELVAPDKVVIVA